MAVTLFLLSKLPAPALSGAKKAGRLLSACFLNGGSLLYSEFWTAGQTYMWSVSVSWRAVECVVRVCRSVAGVAVAYPVLI